VIVACSSACSAGSATLTTVPSMNVIAEARIVAIRVQRRVSGVLIWTVLAFQAKSMSACA